MTTGQFETAAKNAVIDIMVKRYGINLEIDELQFVWFAHELGYKKCTLYAEKLGNYYPEVTYNRAANEMYVDIYLKQSNDKIAGDQLKLE